LSYSLRLSFLFTYDSDIAAVQRGTGRTRTWVRPRLRLTE
jgi:hypothetical protein